LIHIIYKFRSNFGNNNYSLFQTKVVVLMAFLLSMTIYSCGDKSLDNKTDKSIAASVNGKVLYKSDIVLSSVDKLNDKDSLVLAQSFIEHWIRKVVLAENAKKYISNNKTIDKLTEDYRNSLIISAFKRQFVKENLDTIVSSKDLQVFYNDNKNNFVLDHSIVNLWYTKIDEKKKNLDKFYENWKKNNFTFIIKYSKKYSLSSFIELDKWYDLDSIKGELPRFLVKNKDKYQRQLNKNGYEYFIKVLETKHKNETIPLVLVKDKVEKMVLQKRKSDLLDNYIEELYKKEIADNNIKVYN